MGIIYDGNVEEKKLYKAYGLTVYGKINRYVWTIHNGKEDECIITLRISDSTGNNILDLYLGNHCVMYDTFDRTIDNFLYWINTENPDTEQIKKQVYESLCQADCWFNDRIRTRKFNDQREEEERKDAQGQHPAQDNACHLRAGSIEGKGLILRGPVFTADDKKRQEQGKDGGSTLTADRHLLHHKRPCSFP